MPKRVISEKELTACYGLMFSEYPDIVNIRQLQAMLGISRHAAYDLLGEGEIGCIKLGNAYKIPKVNVIRYVLEASAARAERANHVAPPVPMDQSVPRATYQFSPSRKRITLATQFLGNSCVNGISVQSAP